MMTFVTPRGHLLDKTDFSVLLPHGFSQRFFLPKPEWPLVRPDLVHVRWGMILTDSMRVFFCEFEHQQWLVNIFFFCELFCESTMFFVCFSMNYWKMIQDVPGGGASTRGAHAVARAAIPRLRSAEPAEPAEPGPGTSSLPVGNHVLKMITEMPYLIVRQAFLEPLGNQFKFI